jgi:hypothetical protein
LVAPSFTETVRQIAKYVAIGVDLKLFEYQAVENEKKEMGLICRERMMSMQEKAEKFEDPKVKRLWERVVTELPKQQIEVRPVSGHNVTLWYKGRRFMWMRPRRTWFSANILSPAGGWGELVVIRTRKDWDAIVTGRMRMYLAHIDSTAEE